MKKSFLMVAAAAAMLIATGFTACKPNSTPKEVDIYVAGYDKSGTNQGRPTGTIDAVRGGHLAYRVQPGQRRTPPAVHLQATIAVLGADGDL